MHEVTVICGGLSAPRRRRRHAGQTLNLDTSPEAEPSESVQIKIEPVIRLLLDNPPPQLIDLLEIATYVYIADRLVRRETPQMTNMGADWRRRFQFLVPVRCSALWSSPEISEALVDALGFLSEDSFEFSFEQSSGSMQLQPYFGFDQPEARRFSPDDVMLFSGGLDSLAGAASEAIGNGRRLALVTHQSATSVAHRQNDLAVRLAEKLPPESLQYIPVWVRKGDQDPVEHTQRLRSFLFIALGVVIARLFDRQRLLLFENGITSFNLPVAEHVLGTRASRTTHPRVLKNMERLVSLLLDDQFSIENRFLWLTKAEAIAPLSSHGSADLIAMTTSCANVRFLSMKGRQCGICSQCVERRFALAAAGLAGHEPAESYVTDLFDGPYSKPGDAAMAKHHILRAHRLAAMTKGAFAAAYGQVFRTLSAFDGPADQILNQIHDLHRRYGQSVVDVVNQRLQASATLDQALTDRRGSLLPLITAERIVSNGLQDPMELEQPASLQAEEDQRPIANRRLVVALDSQRKRLVFDGGIEIGGACYELASRLVEQFQLDLNSGRTKEGFGYVPTRELVSDLATTEEGFRQKVLRARKLLRKRYLATGYELDDEDVIQSRFWKGYRLNPFLVLVDLAQIAVRPEPSRLEVRAVTTSGPDQRVS